MAHVVHKGPYETCEPTYLALFAWIEEKRPTICGPIREAFPNDPPSCHRKRSSRILRAGPVNSSLFGGCT